MWIMTKKEIYHIGMPRRSGRYPFGSGKRPFQGITNGSSKNIQERYKDTKQAVKAGNEAVNAGKRAMSIYDRTIGKKKTKEYDLSKMSDAELQKAINRMNLEQNYTRLVNNKEATNRGREWVNDTLNNAGDAIAIAGSVATIAWTIHQMKKG